MAVSAGRKTPNVSKARGRSAYVPEDGRAAMAYLGMESGVVGSILRNLGMPFVEGDAERAALYRVKLGLVMDDVTKLERKLTGRASLKQNRILRRWRAYISMVSIRNRIPHAEFRAEQAAYSIKHGNATTSELREAQLQLQVLRSEYFRYKKANDRLRKGKLYLKLANEMHHQLRRRGIRI